MRLLTTSLLIATLTLSACGAVRDSRINPFNWFGRSQSETVVVADTRAETNPLIPEERRGNLLSLFSRSDVVIPTAPMDQVSDLVIERVPGGAIIRATGVSTYVGAFNVVLVPTTEDEVPVDGILTYSLEAARPANARPGGTQRIRTFTVARHVTDNQLKGVRAIRVAAARNARTSSRR
ncbi:MAG: hypothetical protein AAFP16_10065 [Pseudomonadota bacterium]